MFWIENTKGLEKSYKIHEFLFNSKKYWRSYTYFITYSHVFITYSHVFITYSHVFSRIYHVFSREKRISHVFLTFFSRISHVFLTYFSRFPHVSITYFVLCGIKTPAKIKNSRPNWKHSNLPPKLKTLKTPAKNVSRQNLFFLQYFKKELVRIG